MNNSQNKKSADRRVYLEETDGICVPAFFWETCSSSCTIQQIL